MQLLNNDENGAKPLVVLSGLSAYISIGTAQQFVSLLSGIVAIVSGLSAIRYYYIKSKNK